MYTLFPVQQSQLNRRGFTIVELLIVIVVIATLAAISVAAYIGIQNRAHDATVQSDLRGVGQMIQLYSVDEGNLPVYPGDIQGDRRLKFTGASYYDAAWCRATDRLIISGTSASGQGFAWDSSKNAVEKVDGNAGACATFGITWEVPQPRHLMAIKNGATGAWPEHFDH